jgi:tetratricopeptide (TPR) repeat protein
VTRHIARLVAVVACAALVVAGVLPAGAQAKKPKKPKPRPQQTAQPTPQPQQAPPQAPPAGLDAVDRKLWEYKTAEARSAIQQHASLASENGYVAAALGRVLDQEKKYGEAEAQLRKATELAPAEPAPWVYLGETYLRQRKQGEANAAFRKGAELAEARGGGESAYFLGIAQQRLGSYDQALAAFGRATAPSPALLPYQIGVTRAFQENWTAAAEQLDRAIELDSGLAYAYYYRGLAQEKLGRKDRLINDLERFVTLAPEAPDADRARAILRAAKR